MKRNFIKYVQTTISYRLHRVSGLHKRSTLAVLVAAMMITGCVTPSGSTQLAGQAQGDATQDDATKSDSGGTTATGDAGTSDPKDTGAPTGSSPVVIVETNLGTIELELNEAKAPISVANFLAYVDKKFYDGVLFHRVIPKFMIQGGGIATDGSPKSTDAPIKNEAGNGLKNLRGSLAMARTNQIDSGTSQFFINHKDNDFLDHKDESAKGFGYAVFGKVTKGMDVVDKIAAVKTTGAKGQPADKPLTDVVITSIRRK